MLLKYNLNYLHKISFDNGKTLFIDFEHTILNEKRNIFQPLKD